METGFYNKKVFIFSLILMFKNRISIKLGEI